MHWKRFVFAHKNPNSTFIFSPRLIVTFTNNPSQPSCHSMLSLFPIHWEFFTHNLHSLIPFMRSEALTFMVGRYISPPLLVSPLSCMVMTTAAATTTTKQLGNCNYAVYMKIVIGSLSKYQN